MRRRPAGQLSGSGRRQSSAAAGRPSSACRPVKLKARPHWRCCPCRIDLECSRQPRVCGRARELLMHMRVAARTARVVSADEAAGLVRSGMWLDYGTSLCQPDVFDAALATRKADLSNVKIRSCLSMRPRAVIESDPHGDHFHYFSLHFTGYDRKKHDDGRCNYIRSTSAKFPIITAASLRRSTSSSSSAAGWTSGVISISAPPIFGIAR